VLQGWIPPVRHIYARPDGRSWSRHWSLQPMHPSGWLSGRPGSRVNADGWSRARWGGVPWSRKATPRCRILPAESHVTSSWYLWAVKCRVTLWFPEPWEGGRPPLPALWPRIYGDCREPGVRDGHGVHAPFSGWGTSDRYTSAGILSVGPIATTQLSSWMEAGWNNVGVATTPVEWGMSVSPEWRLCFWLSKSTGAYRRRMRWICGVTCQCPRSVGSGSVL
jgi:hypothetical protein